MRGDTGTPGWSVRGRPTSGIRRLHKRHQFARWPVRPRVRLASRVSLARSLLQRSSTQKSRSMQASNKSLPCCPSMYRFRIFLLAHLFTPFLCVFAYSAQVYYRKEAKMMDLVYLLLLTGFFALSAAIVYGCERLRRPS